MKVNLRNGITNESGVIDISKELDEPIVVHDLRRKIQESIPAINTFDIMDGKYTILSDSDIIQQSMVYTIMPRAKSGPVNMETITLPLEAINNALKEGVLHASIPDNMRQIMESTPDIRDNYSHFYLDYPRDSSNKIIPTQLQLKVRPESMQYVEAYQAKQQGRPALDKDLSQFIDSIEAAIPEEKMKIYKNALKRGIPAHLSDSVTSEACLRRIKNGTSTPDDMDTVMNFMKEILTEEEQQQLNHMDYKSMQDKMATQKRIKILETRKLQKKEKKKAREEKKWLSQHQDYTFCGLKKGYLTKISK